MNSLCRPEDGEWFRKFALDSSKVLYIFALLDLDLDQIHSILITARKRSCGKVMFSQVCACSRGVCTHPYPDTWGTTGYGQQAGGAYPTGMNSCMKIYLPKRVYSPLISMENRFKSEAVKLIIADSLPPTNEVAGR